MIALVVKDNAIQNITNKIKKYIIMQLNCISPDEHTRSLSYYGVTSIKYVMLISYIENEFGVFFSDEDFFEHSLDTISDLTKIVCEKLEIEIDESL